MFLGPGPGGSGGPREVPHGPPLASPGGSDDSRKPPEHDTDQSKKNCNLKVLIRRSSRCCGPCRSKRNASGALDKASPGQGYPNMFRIMSKLSKGLWFCSPAKHPPGPAIMCKMWLVLRIYARSAQKISKPI